MRNAISWTIGVILLAGALSAVVAVATVTWVYPKQYATAGEATDKAPAEPTSGAAQTGTAPQTAAAAQANAVSQTSAAPQTNAPQTTAAPPVAPPVRTTPTNDAEVAAELIRRAAAADLPGALALVTPAVTEQDLRLQITRLTPTPLRTALLPGNAGLQIWVDYRREGRPARGYYVVAFDGGKVRSLKGPIAPEGGYGPIGLPIQTEDGQPVELTACKGKGLLLVSARVPEPGLAETLVDLSQTWAPKGIEVVLVTDMRSADWTTAARAAGFSGPVWLVKGRLEDIPLPSKGRLLGAYGVLVDREGYAVASLSALDPFAYDLPDQTTAQIAPTVFKAYGLLP